MLSGTRARGVVSAVIEPCQARAGRQSERVVLTRGTLLQQRVDLARHAPEVPAHLRFERFDACLRRSLHAALHVHLVWVWGLGFGVWGVRCRGQGLGCEVGVQGSWRIARCWKAHEIMQRWQLLALLQDGPTDYSQVDIPGYWVQIRQLDSEKEPGLTKKEPGLTKLVRPNHTETDLELAAEDPWLEEGKEGSVSRGWSRV